MIFVLYPCYAAFFRSIPLSDPFCFWVFKIVALFWFIQYNIFMSFHSSNIHWFSCPWRGSRVGYKFFERGFSILFGLLIQDAKVFAESFYYLIFSHVCREGNSVGNNLTRYVIHIAGYLVWMKDILWHLFDNLSQFRYRLIKIIYGFFLKNNNNNNIQFHVCLYSRTDPRGPSPLGPFFFFFCFNSYYIFNFYSWALFPKTLCLTSPQ